jgi:hypothetical protein
VSDDQQSQCVRHLVLDARLVYGEHVGREVILERVSTEGSKCHGKEAGQRAQTHERSIHAISVPAEKIRLQAFG